jgi:acetyl esterase/lipase
MSPPLAPNLALLSFFSSFLLGACLAPPVVRAAGTREVDLARLLEFVPQAELVELVVEPGVTLRGLYVHASDTGPLLVHFMGAGGSVTAGAEFEWMTYGMSVFAVGAHSDCNSLAIDYRGVGASSGTRDARKLPVDAWAIWCEAVRRANGDSRRIVLRGCSLGTLAAASILDRGAAPRGALLFAPVRAESLVRNWLQQYHGGFTASLLSPWFRKPLELSLENAVANARCPVAAIVGNADQLLSTHEKERLAPLVRASGGCWLETSYNHVELVEQFCGSGNEESDTLEALFPEHTFGVFGEMRRNRRAALNATPAASAIRP